MSDSVVTLDYVAIIDFLGGAKGIVEHCRRVNLPPPPETTVRVWRSRRRVPQTATPMFTYLLLDKGKTLDEFLLREPSDAPGGEDDINPFD